MSTRVVSQFIPRNPFEQMTDTDARIMARDMLDQLAVADGEVIEGELRVGERKPVRLTGGDPPVEYLPPNTAELDGWMVEWSAESRPAPATDQALVGRRLGDDFIVDVPPGLAEARIEHRLGGEVMVRAFSHGDPVGYLLAAALTPDVVSVTLVPEAETTRLVVSPDPDAD